MNINRHNYETFFLDHLEGRLSPEQEIELMEFLSLNPDLAAELTGYESVHLEKEKIVFPEKSDIKKNKGELTPVEKLIALMEGDLTPQETIELKKKIQSDKYLLAQSELISKTKLIPDSQIRFPNKNKLKRRGKVIYMWRYAAVAAAAIVIIGLTIMFRNVPYKKQNQVAEQKSTPALPPVTPSASSSTPEKQEVLVENKKPVLHPSPKKSVEKEKASSQPEQIIPVSPIASNEINSVENSQSTVEPVQAAASAQPVASAQNTFDYSEIFTEAEWKELQKMSKAEKLSWTQKLTKSGMNRLGELTGVHVQFPSKEKEQDVFAFSVGKFEVRHVTAK